MKYLVSGSSSGLGKYLLANLDDAKGFGRNENLDFDTSYETTIVHCAFNKENTISDYYKYLEDNIFLTKNLLEDLKYKKFVYISSVDVYAEDQNMYSTFKRFSESIVDKFPNTLILRCPTLIGNTMKPNHIHKIKDQIENLSLSENSTFCYVNMSKIASFLFDNIAEYSGVIDFVPKDFTRLSEVKEYFKSSTNLGNYTYKTHIDKFINPVYKLQEKYSWNSFDNFKEYVQSM